MNKVVLGWNWIQGKVRKKYIQRRKNNAERECQVVNISNEGDEKCI